VHICVCFLEGRKRRLPDRQSDGSPALLHQRFSEFWKLPSPLEICGTQGHAGASSKFDSRADGLTFSLFDFREVQALAETAAKPVVAMSLRHKGAQALGSSLAPGAAPFAAANLKCVQQRAHDCTSSPTQIRGPKGRVNRLTIKACIDMPCSAARFPESQATMTLAPKISRPSPAILTTVPRTTCSMESDM